MSVRIERLGLRGDGIAPGPVYAAATLPGELVDGDIVGDRIAAPKIIEPSADRVKPPCRHFKACGGCALQHGSDKFVAGWKVDVVHRALAAHGLSAEIAGIHTSAPRSRRRAALAGKRTKSGAIIGFHGRASGTIVEIPDCKLLGPELMATIAALQDLCVAGASRKAELTMQVTQSAAGPDVAVAGGKPLDSGLRVELAALAGRHKLARLVWDDELIAMESPPVQVFGRARVVPPPAAFLQATAQGEAALVAAVRSAVGKAQAIGDLFSGCGTFALPLAEQAEVHAVEGDGAMLKALDAGWRQASGLHKVTTETRDLFRRPLLPDELGRFDAVVIDPPRAGAQAQVAELAGSDIGLIAAVSCNPVTFARDAARLVQAGFGIDRIDVVDQFRWSPHVELVAALRRA